MSAISLKPQAEDQAVIDGVSSVLSEQFPLSRLQTQPDAHHSGVWRHAVELGWIAAGLEEARGGAGFDLVQEMLMNKEYGRHLAPVSLLATALGLRVLTNVGASADAAAIHLGSRRIGLIAFVAGGHFGPAPEGEVQLFDTAADQFILLGEAGAALIERDAVENLRVVEGLDPSIGMARGRLHGRRAVWSDKEDDDLGLRALLLMAAQLTGIALAATAMAVEYAKVRVQFGRPIGAYQAIAHLCVDSAVRAKACEAQVAMAAVAMRDGWEDAEMHVGAAARLAADAAILAATSNIQVHGAMGYSAESGAHLFLKRAVLWKRLLPLKAQAARWLVQRQPEVRAALSDVTSASTAGRRVSLERHGNG